MRRSRPVLALLAGVLVCCGVASCRTSKPPGELVVLVTTDLSVPKDIDTLHVNVSLAGGQSLLSHDYALGPTGLKLPATLGVVTGPHTTAPVTIQVSGLLQGSTRVARETVVTLPTDRMAMLPMPLEWLCIGVSCHSGETCRAGTCVSATAPAIPKDYLRASGDAGGTADGGGACFDTAACFESATLWPAPFRADCTVSRPRG
ncbi:MAG: hypothetical protein M3O36_06935, partial [Myxococcota bacterium]|nr:hypothetical protein [Myxococcota bacterium]